MNHRFTQSLLLSAFLVSGLCASAGVTYPGAKPFDLSRLRYQKDSPSVFSNKNARNVQKINELLSSQQKARKAASVENPTPIAALPPANVVGTLDAPNGETWNYIGEFVYLEIPPHDNVVYTDRILQEYTFTIFDADMNELGVIQDKMDYADNEVRTVLCDVTPVATRNFFNTDDTIEIMIGFGVNIVGGGNNYRTLVYALGGEKDEDGTDKVIEVMENLVADVVEGPSTDGSDNFYITFTAEYYDPEDDSDEGFWSFLLAQKTAFDVYGKAIDASGPREIFHGEIPMIQLPGDQQDVPAVISMRRGDEVIFSVSKYKEPFYNRYDDPFSEEMTMREDNSLLIDLYKVTETGFELFSSTEIPIELDPMVNSEGRPTCLFSYYGVGSLNYRGDFLFDAPGATDTKPEFVITRGNYQVSSDNIVDSYFIYNNDGTLKKTLFLYADAAMALGDIEGFEPQQVFVSRDAYGYMYNFVDLYSAKKVVEIPADYYYDDDSDSELLAANMTRTPAGDSYQYVFELRYPIVDDNENDLLRFIYINADGSYNHIEYVNMGYGVHYAQSYLSTEALAPHAYSTSDVPTFMLLVKRGLEGATKVQEELMVAEAITADAPEGKTLLQLGPNTRGALASIVPEFARDGYPGSLYVYYVDNATSKFSLDLYHLPLDEEYISGVDNIGESAPGLGTEGDSLTASGEIKVYTLDGRLVASGIDSVEFASLEKGIYIVKAAGKSYKILK